MLFRDIESRGGNPPAIGDRGFAGNILDPRRSDLPGGMELGLAMLAVTYNNMIAWGKANKIVLLLAGITLGTFLMTPEGKNSETGESMARPYQRPFITSQNLTSEILEQLGINLRDGPYVPSAASTTPSLDLNNPGAMRLPRAGSR